MDSFVLVTDFMRDLGWVIHLLSHFFVCVLTFRTCLELVLFSSLGNNIPEKKNHCLYYVQQAPLTLIDHLFYCSHLLQGFSLFFCLVSSPISLSDRVTIMDDMDVVLNVTICMMQK